MRWLLLLALLLSAGCPASEAPPPAPAPKMEKAAVEAEAVPPVSDVAPADLPNVPVPEDFAAEVDEGIDASNYRAALDALAREIGQE